jgi:YhcH/YjgK/YiaL family protein
MIYDKIENISQYFDTIPVLKKVEEFINEYNENEKPDGTYVIDGENLYAMVQTNQTRKYEEGFTFEAHLKYIDLQYIVSGVEEIRVSKLDRLEFNSQRYSYGEDIAFYDGEPMFNFTMDKGSFIMLYHNDAHMCGLSIDEDVTVKKIVFKIIDPDRKPYIRLRK